MQHGRKTKESLTISIRLEENLEKSLLCAHEDQNIKAKEEINRVNKKYATRIKYHKRSRNQFIHEVIKNGLISMGYEIKEDEEAQNEGI